MKPLYPACLILLLVAGSAVASDTSRHGEHSSFCAALQTSVDHLIRPWLVHGEAGPDHKAVGAVVGLYVAGHECYFGYGTTRLGDDEVPTRRTLFGIGAVTETFTATMLALREVRNPVFSVLAPVNTSRIPCADNVCLHLANGMEELTYRELATFTGGLFDVAGRSTDSPKVPGTQADLLRYLNDLAAPLSGLPTAFRNSNSNYEFLSELLMSLDGYRDFADPKAFRGSFDAWIGKGIIGPLAMTCTAADLANLPGACGAGTELATGYRFGHGRYLTARAMGTAQGWGVATALLSNAQDLVQYVGAYLGAREVSGVRVPPELSLAMLHARTPTVVDIAGDFAQRRAYAWTVENALHPSRTIVFKQGDTAGYSACLTMLPARHFGTVVLANTARANACVKARTALRRLKNAIRKSR